MTVMDSSGPKLIAELRLDENDISAAAMMTRAAFRSEIPIAPL